MTHDEPQKEEGVLHSLDTVRYLMRHQFVEMRDFFTDAEWDFFDKVFHRIPSSLASILMDEVIDTDILIVKAEQRTAFIDAGFYFTLLIRNADVSIRDFRKVLQREIRKSVIQKTVRYIKKAAAEYEPKSRVGTIIKDAHIEKMHDAHMEDDEKLLLTLWEDFVHETQADIAKSGGMQVPSDGSNMLEFFWNELVEKEYADSPSFASWKKRFLSDSARIYVVEFGPDKADRPVRVSQVIQVKNK